ncbi:hypothetical protein [Peribacillus frigoritolerans]|uniref:hypothetical protein n=1 Tax=Peribacillus frigoritolerans TaxID=450367 RepID=UPI0021A53DB0|nr:hypothetical protein [Peribacillus frigoritolerans]MCT1392016.1 hypothetical protein [Peribacillus frigoritolerans]
MNSHYTIHLNREDYKHVFDLNSLEKKLEWTKRDIDLLKEQIAVSEEYMHHVTEQIELVSSTETEPHVYIHRKNYDNVQFYVGVKHVPKVDFEKFNQNLYIRTSDTELFEGRQRHTAIAYAKSLAEKYGCDIRRQGFPKN